MDPKLLARLLALSMTVSGAGLVAPALVDPALTLPAPLYQALDAAEAARLRALERADLAELRGGKLPERAGLAETEREALRQAEARAGDLERLRGAGLHLSDRDLRIILVTGGILLLLIIIF